MRLELCFLDYPVRIFRLSINDEDETIQKGDACGEILSAPKVAKLQRHVFSYVAVKGAPINLS